MNELKRLAEAKKRLESYIKEEYRSEAAQAISDMLSAQAQSDVEEVEVCVPTKCLLDSVDLGPVRLCDTTKGVLFQAKGSLSVLIDPRQSELCKELRYFLGQMKSDFPDFEGEDKENMQAFAQAWLQVLQAPLFCHIDPNCTVAVATILMDTLGRKIDEMNTAPLQEENPKKDAAFVEAMVAMDNEPKKKSRKKK